ncbi:MAG: hypothetical protein AAFY56_16985 [Pseudomonadota bacterium]
MHRDPSTVAIFHAARIPTSQDEIWAYLIDTFRGDGSTWASARGELNNKYEMGGLVPIENHNSMPSGNIKSSFWEADLRFARKDIVRIWPPNVNWREHAARMPWSCRDYLTGSYSVPSEALISFDEAVDLLCMGSGRSREAASAWLRRHCGDWKFRLFESIDGQTVESNPYRFEFGAGHELLGGMLLHKEEVAGASSFLDDAKTQQEPTIAYDINGNAVPKLFSLPQAIVWMASRVTSSPNIEAAAIDPSGLCLSVEDRHSSCRKLQSLLETGSLVFMGRRQTYRPSARSSLSAPIVTKAEKLSALGPEHLLDRTIDFDRSAIRLSEPPQLIEWADVVIDSSPFLKIFPINPSHQRGSLRAELRCTHWLIEVGKTEPNARYLNTRQLLFSEAMSKWPTLSKRGFGRSLEKAKDQSVYPLVQPGRPKKRTIEPLPEKPPH